MEDYSKETLKKLAYLAVGLLTPEDHKFSDLVDEWIEKGKMTEQEGRKFVEDLVEKAKGVKTDLEDKFKEQSTDILKNIHVATTEQIEALEKRIKALEEEVNNLKG